MEGVRVMRIPCSHAMERSAITNAGPNRRDFLSLAGKGLGLATLSSATVASLLEEVQAATKSVAHLMPEQVAMDEDYWAVIQNSFSVTRGIINLNNGGVSPSTRIASESLEVLLMGMDFKSGDEVLTTTQDYPRMLTTLRQREKREGLSLKLIKIPIPPRDLNEIAVAFEKGVTSRTRLILIAHQINITGQITPVKAVCDMARARGIETIVDGAHSFAQLT